VNPSFYDARRRQTADGVVGEKLHAFNGVWSDVNRH